MLTTPFLTQLDPREQIKGSRDPLGVQSIWTRLGRHVIANLTTVSTSVVDFTVLLLGHYFVERVAEAGGTDGDLATFLKWEQLAAYSRAHINDERGFRGTERVWKRLRDDDTLRLGVDAEAQILGDQKIYGLWGLFTVPAKASGLLEGDPTRLTSEARAVVERALLPLLDSVRSRMARMITDRLRATKSVIDTRKAPDVEILRAVGKVLEHVRAHERGLYREHLRAGGRGDADLSRGTRGKQRLLADLLDETQHDPEWELSPTTLTALTHRAAKHGEVGEQLAFRLARIRDAELLLAPAVALFEHVLAYDGQSTEQIAASVGRHWGSAPKTTIDVGAIEALEPELRSGGDGADTSARWIRLARALHEGEYENAVRVVIEQNAAVMHARAAAAAWVIEREGHVEVRFRDAHLLTLPNGDDLPTYWRHAYFLDALRRVSHQLRGDA